MFVGVVNIIITGFLLINAFLVYGLRGTYFVPLLICTLTWWIYDSDFPKDVFKVPTMNVFSFNTKDYERADVVEMGFSLLFLYLLSISSTVASLGHAAGLIRRDGTLSRNRWLFILCGFMSIVSGYLGGPPILVSPESISGILAGGRTGISAITCGCLIACTLFFEPVMNQIPAVATAPIMFVIGMLMFTNVSKIKWNNIRESASAFVILFFVPFTYSTLTGVIFGYCVYIG
jgi:adenine/guanine/hypoxanthine permease